MWWIFRKSILDTLHSTSVAHPLVLVKTAFQSVSLLTPKQLPPLGIPTPSAYAIAHTATVRERHSSLCTETSVPSKQ